MYWKRKCAETILKLLNTSKGENDKSSKAVYTWPQGMPYLTNEHLLSERKANGTKKGIMT